MKLSRPVAVFAAVVLLAGGAAVAVNAATSSPVKLCSNSKTATVSIPSSSGDCAKGFTPFYVASDADVQALATRLGQAETRADEQAAAIDALEVAVEDLKPGTLTVTAEPQSGNSWNLTVTGARLWPGAAVTAHYFHLNLQTTSQLGVVADDGTVNLPDTKSCADTNVYYTTFTRDDVEISSEGFVKGPGCP
jgi:hypothetical protein